MLEAVFLMLPALTAVIYQELHCILVFLGSAVFCLAVGALLRGKKPENTTIYFEKGKVYNVGILTLKPNDIFCRRLCVRCTLLGGS